MDHTLLRGLTMVGMRSTNEGILTEELLRKSWSHLSKNPQFISTKLTAFLR